LDSFKKKDGTARQSVMEVPEELEMDMIENI
jgi:hypothetical protein